MLLSVLASISISTIIFIALLLITRQRLARQFENIQRRLVVTERTFAAIKLAALKLEIEHGTTHTQLQRLHMGLVRVQENAACRHGALVPPAKRALSELQSAALQQWAGELGVPLEPRQVEELSHAVERAEMLEPKDIQIGTSDLLAQIIAVIGRQERNVSIGLADASARSLASLLQRVASGFFEGLEVFQIPGDTEGFPGTRQLDALVLDAAVPFDEIEPVLGPLKEGGIIVLQNVPVEDGGERNFPGFRLIAAEWNTRIYRKSTV